MSRSISSKVIRAGAVAALGLILSARAARTGTPAGRYVLSGTETALDTKTGLTWQRVAPSTRYRWEDAKAYCAGGTGLTGTGWRLPTINELSTLMDFSKTQPYYLDTTVFSVPTSPVDGVFWTSTATVGKPANNFTNGAWNVYFKEGVTLYNDVIVGAWARCVR